MKRNFAFLSNGLPLFCILAAGISSCHLSYDSNELDLTFYQWNKWEDVASSGSLEGEMAIPSVGWEVFNRGVGELVRIPSEAGEGASVTWYHCHFTLPDEWEKREILLHFEGAGPRVEVFLNESFISSHSPEGTSFSVDNTPKVFYTRDNHLAIRISGFDSSLSQEPGGITGDIRLRSTKPPAEKMKNEGK